MPSSPPDTADIQAIKTLIASEDEAWGRGDAVAFSRRIRDDCVFTNIFGQQFVGREGFEAQHARIFATIYKGSRLEQSIAHLRFLRPDVAAADTEAVVTPSGAEPLRTKLLQVFVKDAGEWWIAAYHNAPVRPPPV